MADTSTVVGVTARVTGDVVSLSIVVGALAKILPPLAALFSILWIMYQFYHSEPMKEMRRKRKEKKNGMVRCNSRIDRESDRQGNT